MGKTEAAKRNFVCFEKKRGNLKIALVSTSTPKRIII
jgi:hypothetical protein